MPTQDLTLMQALTKKMAWLDQRQQVIAQNIANADTPGYRPQELTKPDFKELLNLSTSSLSLSAAPSLSQTDPNHLGLGGSTSKENFAARQQKETYETAPAGNAVVLEEQLLNMNQNFTDYNFVTNLYQKNLQMLKSALKTQ